MGDSIFINGRAAVHKGSNGKSVASPDVCLCPPGPPAGPVPTPLVNSVVAADMDGGTMTVLVEGNPQGTRQSFFRKSTGNEVARATGGGVLTGVVQGQAKFRFGYSRNVFIEGEPAVRHLDPLTHNHAGFAGNTPPAPWVSKTDPEVLRMPPNKSVKDLARGKDWIGIHLVDESGYPLTYAIVEIALPDGSTEVATVLRSGVLEFRGIPKGSCGVTCKNFGDKRRRTSHRESNPSFQAAAKPGEVNVTRSALAKKLEIPTGRMHKLVVLPELQDLPLRLVSVDKDPIPEAEFLVTFATGEQRRGRLDRDGTATVRQAPPGPFTVEYPDHVDLRAKSLAARAARVLKDQDPSLVVAVLSQSSDVLPAVAAAFDRYFGTGARFVDQVQAVTAGRPEEVVVEHLLSGARLASTVVAMGWEEHDRSGDADLDAGERIA